VKQQPKYDSRAHFFQGAFYLLVLLPVCLIPFALAQRNTTRQGVVVPTAPTPQVPYDLRAIPEVPALQPPNPGPSGGYDVIINGGFETGDFTGWTIDGFNNSPVVTNTNSHSGTYSAFAGGQPTGGLLRQRGRAHRG
jgi:hypothetical protein